MKKLIILAIAIVISVSSYAQNYKSSVGLRLGYPVAGSFKTFISETSALEGIVGFGSYSSYLTYINVRANYLIHSDIESVENLQWFYGAGVGVFIWSYDDLYFSERNNNIGLGISGIIGAEYTFEDLPLAVSVDWAPTFIVSGVGSGFGSGYGAFTVRYILGRD
ncbi:MAG: hypothetical protein ACI86M_001790 [Saprospiraceae bacterium]|jgi:hypothetical protein